MRHQKRERKDQTTVFAALEMVVAWKLTFVCQSSAGAISTVHILKIIGFLALKKRNEWLHTLLYALRT